MSDEIAEKGALIPTAANHDLQLRNFEVGLVSFLRQHDLPTKSIFVGVPERENVFKNLDGVISQIEVREREQSLYLSKFIAGVASGLFDAALNYLWDETILQIRRRVVQYDLEYFFDNAVSGDKRTKLKDETDLEKIDNYDLIKGAKEIGLISDLGFKHLEYINYMRNWASAAHPNQNEITGLQIVSWLETCVKEVISLPIPTQTIQIKQLLSSIKTTNISEVDAQGISLFFTNLTQEQVNKLVAGFFGIYTKPDTDSNPIQNINRLLPLIWDRVDQDTRDGFGLKYGNFVANNSQHEKTLAREFLQLVNAESHIPDDLRAVEIEAAINNLLNAHRGMNNFYNEPSFATQLQRIIGESSKVPKELNRKFVLAIVQVFLTNANGVANGAEPVYKELIGGFDSNQSNIAVLSFTDDAVSSKLQFALCRAKFNELIVLLKPKITSPPVKDLIQKIERFRGKPEMLRNDAGIKSALQNLKVLLPTNST